MEKLLLYDQWFKWKNLHDEFTYVENLVKFYTTAEIGNLGKTNNEGGEKNPKDTDKKGRKSRIANCKFHYPHGYEEEFKLFLDSSSVMGENLRKINKELNSMADILSQLSNNSDSRGLRIFFLEKYMKIEKIFSEQCLRSFNFLQRKLESLVNVYPANFPEPKVLSFKEAYETHTYIELLLDEFSEILYDSHILSDYVPKKSNIYWRFDRNIFAFMRSVAPENKEKILIVNSDFYTLFRHSQWILFFHEILHTSIEHCLIEASHGDKNCKKIKDIVSETSISIYSIFKSFNIPMGIFFEPRSLVVDVLIDVNLARLFLEKYIIAAFLNLFLYDQYDLYSYRYVFWFIRIRTLMHEVEKLSTRKDNDFFYKLDFYIINKFRELHEKYFLGKYGSFLYDLYGAISDLLIRTMETYSDLLKFRSIKNKIEESGWISTYLSFLDNFYKYTMERFGEIDNPQKLLKETFEDIYIYERDALIHAFSRNIFPFKQESYIKKTEDPGVNQSNEAKESNTPFNEKPVSLILKLYKYRYDTPKRGFKHNIYNCGDYTTVEFIYGKQGGEENGEMLEKQQGQPYGGYKYEWYSYLVELYRHENISDNKFSDDKFFGNLTEKLLILSKLSFTKKVFKEFRKGSKNSESELLKEILNKFEGFIENDGLFSKKDKNDFRIYSSFDWYDLTVLFNIKLNKKLNYNDLSKELFNVYTNLTTENTNKLKMDKNLRAENTNITNFTETLIFVGENAMDKFVLNSPELLIRVSNDEESYAAINKIMSKEQLRKVLGLNENDFNVKLYLGKIDVKIVFNGDIECSKLRNYIEKLIELDKPKIFEVRIIP